MARGWAGHGVDARFRRQASHRSPPIRTCPRSAEAKRKRAATTAPTNPVARHSSLATLADHRPRKCRTKASLRFQRFSVSAFQLFTPAPLTRRHALAQSHSGRSPARPRVGKRWRSLEGQKLCHRPPLARPGCFEKQIGRGCLSSFVVKPFPYQRKTAVKKSLSCLLDLRF